MVTTEYFIWLIENMHHVLIFESSVLEQLQKENTGTDQLTQFYMENAINQNVCFITSCTTTKKT